MNPDVFIDASAWIAVSDRHDKYHQSANVTYRRLIEERRMMATTNLVIAEAYIVIRRTGGHSQAIRFLRSLRGSPRLLKVYSDSEIESNAEKILEKHRDQDHSFVDAVSFVVMQSWGIEEALTFDSHFATMGFRMIPARY